MNKLATTIIISILLSTGFSQAQTSNPFGRVADYSRSLQGEVLIGSEGFRIEKQSSTSTDTATMSRIKVLNAQLRAGGTLVVDYELAPEGRFNGEFFRIGLNATFDGQTAEPTIADLDEYFTNQISLEQAVGPKRIEWSGVQENFITGAGDIQINLFASLYGYTAEDIQNGCPNGLPRFGASEKKPYLYGYVVSLTVVAAGAGIYIGAQNAYDDYKQQTIKEVATPILDKANRQNQIAISTIGLGLGIAATSGLLHWLKHRNYKKDLDRYNTNCLNLISRHLEISPDLQLSPNYNGIYTASVGLELSYKF